MFRLQTVEQMIRAVEVVRMIHRQAIQISPGERCSAGWGELQEHPLKENTFSIGLPKRLAKEERTPRLARADPSLFVS